MKFISSLIYIEKFIIYNYIIQNVIIYGFFAILVAICDAILVSFTCNEIQTLFITEFTFV